ncbi:MAG: PD-(D/E)XK nuclease family protein, partial [Chloroflexota bacterium]
MQLLLARVGAGKTIALQERLLELKQRKPLAKVWVLLSTERQIVDFRQRFMNGAPPPGQVSFNVEYFNFYSLYHHLLAIVGKPQRCLDDTARYGLIRAMLSDLYANGGGIFGGIALMPGFIEIIAAFIYELKQNLIFPEAFVASAESAKELELAQIYTEYQLALRRHDLVDREGEGWVALEALERKPKIVGAVDLLVVDGYDQFNALQANLLTVLGSQVRESLVALTTVPGREATIGRRFADAVDRLTAAHAARGMALDVIPFTARRDQRHPALKHLSEQLLRPRPEKVAVEDAVQWIEAPDPAHEVGALLRRVKRLLLEGCPPDDILIAVRDWSLYGEQIASQGQTYDLPLALHYGEALARNPAVVALLDLLSLHTGDFRRHDLLDGLRSPYFAVPGLDSARIDGLDRIGVEMQITGGRSAWLEALDLMAKPPAPQREDEGAQALPQLDEALARSLKAALADFFAGVTPPERGTVESYIDWLEKLIGADIADPDDEADAAPENFFDALNYSINLPAQIRRDADAASIARDLAAMQQFKQILRGLLSAQALAESLDYRRVIDRKTFLRDLKTAVDNTTVGRGSARDGRVLVTTVTDARGLPQRHIFILGLSEGIFPQPAPEDPLLLDSERERLRGKGIKLPTQAERAGDDGLFYSLIGQARDSLTLSRPHSKNGETWAASHLWRAALAVFSDAHVEHLAPGAVPLDPATQHEAALAAVDALVEGRSGAALLDWIDRDYWRRIQRGRDIELGRISMAAHDRYSGRLSDADLIAQVAQLLNPDRVWSASQLNDYGLCGFRYFAARLLKLEALEEPEDGMDVRQLGTLFHEILEQTYARFARLGGAITPDRRYEALIVLGQVAEENMIDAPERLRFRASPQWAQEKEVLRRRLEKL